ncbi:chromate transporter [Oceanobacillus sp. 1P07AA]|uniref:chromate transporter n=1 Tax=Oceanobacillus sp. 1P07AA TaxID=3132293 RepID=UPI0039A66AC2
MIYWEIFVAFFIPGILGYGGGPASIPLVENEVVRNFEWMSTQEFGEVLAFANSLPGPIATKLAGYIGFEVGGYLGAGIGLFASIAPSLILMILLGGILIKYKKSPRIKRLTLFVQTVIAILLGVLAWNFWNEAYIGIGFWQTAIIVVLSYYLIERRNVHPAFIIAGALLYGGFFL